MKTKRMVVDHPQLALYDEIVHKKTGEKLPRFTVIIGTFYLSMGLEAKCDYQSDSPFASFDEITRIGVPDVIDGYLSCRKVRKDSYLLVADIERAAHPKEQVAVIESLAILSTMGINLVVTTYSPYIMAHLNNLICGNHQNTDVLKAQARSLYLQDHRAFLSPEQVGAYEIKNDELVSLYDPDYGIRWDSLSDVSVDIQQKYFEINS